MLNSGAGGLATAQVLAFLERPRALLEGGGHAEGALDVHLERASPSNCIIRRGILYISTTAPISDSLRTNQKIVVEAMLRVKDNWVSIFVNVFSTAM